MMEQKSRYAASMPWDVAAGLTITRVTPPSRLYGANGIRTGADGRIYGARVSGSQINAIDINTGAMETISPMGSAIVAPDDLVLDSQGKRQNDNHRHGTSSRRRVRLEPALAGWLRTAR